MSLYARDVMVQDFQTIHPNAPVEEAIRKISNGVVRETGFRTVSLMVVDEVQRLCGVVTMFDLLYHLRPDFLNTNIDSRQLKWEGQLDILLGNLEGKQVRQIMTPNVVGVEADDHIMVLLDQMVKNRYQRIPVLTNGRIVGVVYLSDVYHHLFARPMKPTRQARAAGANG